MPGRIPVDWVMLQGPDPWLCAQGCNHVGAVDIYPNIARCGNCAAEWGPGQTPENNVVYTEERDDIPDDDLGIVAERALDSIEGALRQARENKENLSAIVFGIATKGQLFRAPDGQASGAITIRFGTRNIQENLLAMLVKDFILE